jgi:cobalt-zinc-cadmium efflux system protein
MHDHARHFGEYNRAFLVGITLNAAFIVVEIIFGLLSGSLALLADAGHNVGDVMSLLIAWGATFLAARPPSRRRTYGLRRSTILASLINAIILLIAMGAIAWEAVGRLFVPMPVPPATVITVAAVGVVINTATALLFMKGRRHDLNIKGAFLHMAADAGVSLVVVVGGVLIALFGWLWIDPLLSLLIVAVIAVGTWGLLRDSANLALDAVPPGINPDAVEAYLASLPGVHDVHDLHIWAMSTTHTALTAHLVKPDGRIDDALLARVCRELGDRFGIGHVTIQMESGDEANPCHLAPTSVV